VSPLEQGDFLSSILVPLTPALNADTAGGEQLDKWDQVVVLSQSCDLSDSGISRVMVCPVVPLGDLLQGLSATKKGEFKGQLKSGRRPAYQLLNLCELPGFVAPHLVADFGEAFSIPIDEAVAARGSGDRLRLLPPYREYLAQAFARFYMRIGLPVDVAPFP
jgi:hypothetical protein